MDTIDADPTEAQGLDLAVTQALLQAADTTVETFIVNAARAWSHPSGVRRRWSVTARSGSPQLSSGS